MIRVLCENKGGLLVVKIILDQSDPSPLCNRLHIGSVYNVLRGIAFLNPGEITLGGLLKRLYSIHMAQHDLECLARHLEPYQERLFVTEEITKRTRFRISEEGFILENVYAVFRISPQPPLASRRMAQPVAMNEGNFKTDPVDDGTPIAEHPATPPPSTLGDYLRCGGNNCPNLLQPRDRKHRKGSGA